MYVRRLTQAYLRIRPEDERPETFSLDVVSDTEVVMTPPHEMSARTASRLRGQAVPAKYTFSKVFSRPETDAPTPAAMQSQFFQETTLPLVRDLLEGRNSLVFTYGVTNSGKTYTVQGSQAPGEAGILPRAIDVIFNSTKGLECTKAIRPMGLTGVQPGVSDPSKSLLSFARKPRDVPALEVDPTCVPVSDEFRYSVWVSYVEVYNEKLYDLLDTPSASLLQREPRDDTSAARRPLLLKSEVESGGKYVSGLKEIKVSSIAEAKELLYRGQENRTVFSTMANRTSSRSHSVFTIKILREQTSVALEDRDIAGLSRKYFISRMSIVDLAGSERVANTEVPSGPRLKEAGNINKSLMCLGQCLETMRKNQIRAGIFHGERTDASDSQSKPRRRQSIIPFRHSKLTELFQSFFTGDGRVVMIVNVNPYGTGFEESANVMRFSAMAKDVGIHVAPNERASPTKRSSSLPNTSGMTVLDAGESDDEDEDPFVTMLIEENERLRNKVRRPPNPVRARREPMHGHRKDGTRRDGAASRECAPQDAALLRRAAAHRGTSLSSPRWNRTMRLWARNSTSLRASPRRHRRRLPTSPKAHAATISQCLEAIARYSTRRCSRPSRPTRRGSRKRVRTTRCSSSRAHRVLRGPHASCAQNPCGTPRISTPTSPRMQSPTCAPRAAARVFPLDSL